MAKISTWRRWRAEETEAQIIPSILEAEGFRTVAYLVLLPELHRPRREPSFRRHRIVLMFYSEAPPHQTAEQRGGIHPPLVSCKVSSTLVDSRRRRNFNLTDLWAPLSPHRSRSSWACSNRARSLSERLHPHLLDVCKNM